MCLASQYARSAAAADAAIARDAAMLLPLSRCRDESALTAYISLKENRAMNRPATPRRAPPRVDAGAHA